MKFNFLIEMLSNTIATAGESKLVDVLQELHDSNPADYKAAIDGGHALVLHLQPLVAKSATKIDDAVLNALNEAINQSASANGITF